MTEGREPHDVRPEDVDRWFDAADWGGASTAAPREALERLTRWRDSGTLIVEHYPSVNGFKDDVKALLFLVEKQQEALKAIVSCKTTSANATVTRMARIADEALESSR